MRISRTGRILIGAAILLGMVLAWVVSSWPPSRNYRLADGTVLRVERVSFGARDPAYAPPVSLFEDWKGKLAAMLPKTWAGKISVRKFTSSGTWWMNATIHSNVHSLNIWITRRDLTNGFAFIQRGPAELVDDQGCVYPATQGGGVSQVRGGFFQSLMVWFTFEAYPRHQSKMRLRLYSLNYAGTNQSRELLAEFMVLNPAPRATSAAGWTLEPLPTEKKFGDVSFTLKSVGYKTNWIEGASNSFPWNYSANPVEILPKFAVLEHGRQTAQWRPADVGRDLLESQSLVEQPSDWDALDVELSDNSGNIAPKQWGHPMSLFLSPSEPAWKLAVKFFGSEQSDAASNSVWIIHDVKVPEPAEYTALPYLTNLDGVYITTVALAGAGRAVYEGEALKEISTHSSELRGGSSYMANGPQEQVVDLTTPHISLTLSDFQEDQRLTIRAVTPEGEEYYAQSQSPPYNASAAPARRISYLEKSPSPYRLTCFPIDLPAGVKTVDLYVCVHRARVINFIFKPPLQ
jgi:hypothetical protein